MIEKDKSGGLCFVGSRRYSKATNRYLPDYDTIKPSNYILYADANKLVCTGNDAVASLDGFDSLTTDIALRDFLDAPDERTCLIHCRGIFAFSRTVFILRQIIKYLIFSISLTF